MMAEGLSTNGPINRKFSLLKKPKKSFQERKYFLSKEDSNYGLLHIIKTL